MSITQAFTTTWLSQSAILLDSMSDSIISTGLDYRIKSWNRSAQEMFGLRAEDVLEKKIHEVVHYTFRTDSREIAQQKLKEEGNWKGQIIHTTATGKELILEINSSTIKSPGGASIGYVSVYRDITDMQQMERAIIKAIMEAQEKERREISSELHDNVNQILTTCKLFLDIARNEPDNLKFIDECQVNIQHVIEEIRNISHNLTPYSLKDLGLIAALHDTIQQLNRSGKLQIRLLEAHNLRESSIHADIKLAIFRIVQEKISNVLKHAQATELTIEFGMTDDRIMVILTDNGLGFDEKATRKGMGLYNISNRVEYFKGNMLLKTAPGEGCELRVELPCQ